MARSLLTEEMWVKVKPLLPPQSGYWGRPSRSHRTIIEGILWIFRTGAPWRDLPEEYGPWSSCFNRFNRWSANGTWRKIWEILKKEIDEENLSIDGSIVKAHQDACRIKKKPEEALGKSRGGMTTKIHAVTDGLGRCIDFTLIYKERHLVENFFQFIKRFRRIGTRYEKSARNYTGMVTIGCILQWLIF